MRRIYIIIVLLSLALNLNAQEQNSIWMHGNNVGLDFTTNPISTFYSPHNILSTPPPSGSVTDNNATSAVCDTAGNLLFSVNRNTVLDRYHDTLPNGRNLMGHAYGSFQASMIIPYPNSCNKYIVFKTNSHENGINFTQQNLSYSVVDMCLNNGLGDVVQGQKNILLSDSCLSPMIAIPHENKRDIWLIVHSCMGTINNYESYLVTPNGVNPTPVISNFPVDSGMLNFAYYGLNNANSSFSHFFIRASSNGNLIASNFGSEVNASLFGLGGISNVLKLYNFDRNTGQLSFNIDITQHLNNFIQIWGFEFSSNDNYLYMAVSFDRTQWPNWSSTNGDIKFMLQYDINNQTWTDVDTLDAHRVYDMRLGPDGKIYTVNTRNSSYMGVINNPNAYGRACNFVSNGIPLLTGNNRVSYLPNHFKGWDELTAPRTFLPEDTILCMGEELVTNVSNTVNDCNISNYFWHDSSRDSIKTFDQTGTYWLEVHDMCGIDRDTLELEVRDLSFSLGNDTTLCEENSFKLYADSSQATNFLWNNNTNLRFLNANSNGVFWCEISDSICAFRDSIYVCFFDMPNLFLGNDTTLCRGETLDLSLNDPNITAILWNNGSVSNNMSISDSGLYSVTLWNNICQITDSIQIAIAELPDLNWAPSDTFFCFNQSMDLYFPNDNSLYFTWNGNPAYSPVTVHNAGVYVLKVSNQYCSAETNINIGVEDCLHIYIPNTFTPNGDGLNEEFAPIADNDILDYHLIIYDRWGEKIFDSNSQTQTWDGTFKGTECQNGSYVWMLQYNNMGRSYEKNGKINLLR